MKHKHYDLIIAWAGGAQIEQLFPDLWKPVDNPQWLEKHQYRIKPAAKPCPERMTEYLNELLYKAERHESQTIAFEEDILLALKPKEET